MVITIQELFQCKFSS